MQYIPKFFSQDLLGNFQFPGVPLFGPLARYYGFSYAILMFTFTTAPVFGAKWQRDSEEKSATRFESTL